MRTPRTSTNPTELHRSPADDDRDRTILVRCPFPTEHGGRWIPDYVPHRSDQPLGEVDLDPPATTKRHLRLVTTSTVEQDAPDGCSPWSCRFGATVAPERAA
jgi:hypothetical protein